MSYGDVRRSLAECVLCGVMRHGIVQFGPRDDLVLNATDKLVLLASKRAFRTLPPSLQALANGRVTGAYASGRLDDVILMYWLRRIAYFIKNSSQWHKCGKMCLQRNRKLPNQQHSRPSRIFFLPRTLSRSG